MDDRLHTLMRAAAPPRRWPRRLALLLAPLILVGLAEAAFRCGVWEPLAARDSHAGTSVAVKRAARALPRIDFVTLGSSRPVYGIDHARLADVAAARGLTHVNLSMPGSHWMTVGILGRWLARERPPLHGGVIALSVQDLAFAGNGSYELDIVRPFATLADTAWIAAHVPLRVDQVATYGTYSALFGWREDVRDWVRNPGGRERAVRDIPDDLLRRSPSAPESLCRYDLDLARACAAIAQTSAADDELRRQCAFLTDTLASYPDYAELVERAEPPAFMALTRDLVQGQLRALDWARPPVVVLMPMPPMWRSQPSGRGLHQWARAVLAPLDAAGEIRLIDATAFFDDAERGGCGQFRDFYHQNDDGRRRLTDWLLPQIQAHLYAPLASGPG